MNKSSIQPGYIYTKDRFHRMADHIVKEAGEWMVFYHDIGHLIIRGKVHHFPGAHKCKLETFARWAKDKETPEHFLESRQEASA